MGGIMVANDETVETLYNTFIEICPGFESLLYPGGFRDSGLAVISSVFSIQAKDEAVRSVVDRFAQRQGVEVAALGGPDRESDAYSVARLAEDLAHLSEDELTGDVFGSRAKSARAGRTKAALVQEVARKLVAAGVFSRDDVAISPSGEQYELQKKAWTGVHGLGWVTFEYFRLLCGAETAKPDTMIHRWLERAIGREVNAKTALSMVKGLAAELERRWTMEVSPRAVDHTIWFHESGRAETD
jgi:hypothetical protein